jgi:hypothetical protein
MAELNNLPVSRLPEVLTADTLMEGHWGLIDGAAVYCLRLHDAGVKCSADLFELAADAGRLRAVTDAATVPVDYILGLNRLLLFHAFRPVPLKMIEGVEAQYVAALQSRRLKDTGAILLACATARQRATLSADAGIPVSEVERLVTASDLMRKPGIKAVKVRLFTACGINSLKHLGEQEPTAFRSRLEALIASTGVVRAVPTPKEVASDVRWARLYPAIVSWS